MFAEASPKLQSYRCSNVVILVRVGYTSLEYITWSYVANPARHICGTVCEQDAMPPPSWVQIDLVFLHCMSVEN